MAKKKDEKTNVMRILEQKKIAYTPHFYEESEGPEGTSEYGVHIAKALGQDPARAFKTLVARGASKNYIVFEVPVAENLDLKKAAKAAGEKSVELLHVAEINAVTGYIRGGCSPVGMKKQFLTVFHETAKDFSTIFISGGKIGAQVEVEPDALLQLTKGKTGDIIV
ncbi:MAG: Cys-tRNA(Pro) deacylase [Oscillibacter sp.]|jgi:Cys-tRNA(Pro)/Cys-tRNA(Cys) deacylase|nr:Cys-tRNA(Pro) deacylase [Oscillibacter sp.]